MILLRLLADHPDVDEIIPVSSSRFGQPAASVDPGIGKAIEKKLNLCKGNLVTLEEAVAMNPVLVTRTITDAHEISETDTEFFKVFSAKKTYLMTLSTEVYSESNAYHFENGNEALPVVFKIVK